MKKLQELSVVHHLNQKTIVFTKVKDTLSLIFNMVSLLTQRIARCQSSSGSSPFKTAKINKTSLKMLFPDYRKGVGKIDTGPLGMIVSTETYGIFGLYMRDLLRRVES